MSGISLITGSTGFIGSHFVNYICKTEPDETFRLLVRGSSINKANTTFQKLENIEIVEGDVTDIESLEKGLVNINRIFHIAAAADDNIGKDMLHEVNVEGTENLLRTALGLNSDIFFCYLSSTGVYGNKLPDKSIKEEFRKKPSSNYQASKWNGEQKVWEYFGKGLKGSILRSPSTIGPGDLKTFYRICVAVKNRKFPLVGGDNTLTFIDVEDLSQALSLAGAYKNQKIAANKAYNLYSFRITLKKLLEHLVAEFDAQEPKKTNYRLAFSMAVLAEFYSKVTGKKTTLNRYRVRKFGASRKYDMSMIEKDLQYKPFHDFNKVMARSLDWLYDNGYLDH